MEELLLGGENFVDASAYALRERERYVSVTALRDFRWVGVRTTNYARNAHRVSFGDDHRQDLGRQNGRPSLANLPCLAQPSPA